VPFSTTLAGIEFCEKWPVVDFQNIDYVGLLIPKMRDFQKKYD
jgi:hypothetical protein